MNRYLWKLEDVEGEGADEVIAVDEESSEDNEDPYYAFNLSPVFASVTIRFYRSSLSYNNVSGQFFVYIVVGVSRRCSSSTRDSGYFHLLYRCG
jgi:hypothetical protein